MNSIPLFTLFSRFSQSYHYEWSNSGPPILMIASKYGLLIYDELSGHSYGLILIFIWHVTLHDHISTFIESLQSYFSVWYVHYFRDGYLSAIWSYL